MGIFLQIGVICAGRGRKEIAPGARSPGGLDEVRVDQYAAQAFHAEVLDEAHAAHVRGEIVNFRRVFDSPHRIRLLAQIHREALHARNALVPIRQGFAIDGPDRDSPGNENSGPATADEPTAGNDDQVMAIELAIDLYLRVALHGEISLYPRRLRVSMAGNDFSPGDWRAHPSRMLAWFSDHHFLESLKGTRDLLPPSTDAWNRVEAVARAVFRAYNYREIRMPLS